MKCSVGSLNISVKENAVVSKEIITEMKRHARREKYLYERDKNKIISFNDEYADNNNLVEDVINTKNLRIALQKALSSLSNDELQIIVEVFLDNNEEVNYTKLAKTHGISRQCYTRKLNRILAKLRHLINNYYIEF